MHAKTATTARARLGVPYGRIFVFGVFSSPNQPYRNNLRLFLPLKILYGTTHVSFLPRKFSPHLQIHGRSKPLPCKNVCATHKHTTAQRAIPLAEGKYHCTAVRCNNTFVLFVSFALASFIFASRKFYKNLSVFVLFLLRKSFLISPTHKIEENRRSDFPPHLLSILSYLLSQKSIPEGAAQ